MRSASRQPGGAGRPGGEGEGAEAVGEGPSWRPERVTAASLSFPGEQVRRRGRGSTEIHAGREKYDSTSRFLALVDDVAPF